MASDLASGAPLRHSAVARGRCYLDRARSYGRAAAALASNGVRPDVHAPYFMLVAHAAELALKAALPRRVHDDEQLIVVGHDLRLCLRLAIANGLDLDAQDEIETIVGALAMPHLAQALRYPAYLAWPLPEANQALHALETLLAEVEALLAARAQQ